MSVIIMHFKDRLSHLIVIKLMIKLHKISFASLFLL